VNEPSFTILHLLVCFLRTNIGGSFFYETRCSIFWQTVFVRPYNLQFGNKHVSHQSHSWCSIPYRVEEVDRVRLQSFVDFVGVDVQLHRIEYNFSAQYLRWPCSPYVSFRIISLRIFYRQKWKTSIKLGCSVSCFFLNIWLLLSRVNVSCIK